MAATSILKDISTRKFKPVYLLHGEESYFIDQISKKIEKEVLTEAERGFNQTIVYGKDTDGSTIVSIAKRYPMMSEYQVVIVKEAQNVKDLDKMEAYFAQPQPSTILVICHKEKKVDGRKKFIKVIAKTGVVFESKKLYDNQLPEWIRNKVAEFGFRIQDKAALLMADHLGNDLSKVVHEIEKLSSNLPKGTAIDSAHIEEYIGISKDFNVFEFCDALGAKNAKKAYTIGDYFSKNSKAHPLVMIIGGMLNYFTKMLTVHFLPNKDKMAVASALKLPPFLADQQIRASRNFQPMKVIRIIHDLRDADAKSKGIGSTSMSDEDIYKELIFKILSN